MISFSSQLSVKYYQFLPSTEFLSDLNKSLITLRLQCFLTFKKDTREHGPSRR